MASKVCREVYIAGERHKVYVDGAMSRELERIAAERRCSVSTLLAHFAQEGLARRQATIAESMTYAGVGTAALTAIVLLAFALGVA